METGSQHDADGYYEVLREAYNVGIDVETLRKANWATHAVSLVRQCESLDMTRPAIMFIRHTARPEIENLEQVSHISPTVEGLEAAREFGASLPRGRYYRIYHGEAERCQETAERITDGIKGNRGRVESRGSPSFFRHHGPHVDLNRSVERMMEEGIKSFFINWVSGRYPPAEMEPSIDFAKRVAAEMLGELVNAPPDCFDIYISHDAWTLALLYHWFGGGWGTGRIQPLDGFIFQLEPEEMVLYYGGERKAVAYPHWWK